MLAGGLEAWELAGYPVEAGAPSAAAKPAPQRLYEAHCATCHQPNGQGVPDQYPSLAGNGLTTMADPRALILVTLEGLNPAPSKGRPRPARMPGFKARLSDAEMAEVLTHVRSSWGNHAPAVKPAQVKALR